MNRLTIKDKAIRDNFNAEYAKLADLEDIEEELGIDLITLFDVLNGGIWALHPITKNKCLIIYPALYYCDNQWVIGCQSMQWNDETNNYDCWECLLKDYGKTWAKSINELKK